MTQDFIRNTIDAIANHDLEAARQNLHFATSSIISEPTAPEISEEIEMDDELTDDTSTDDVSTDDTE